MRRIVKGLAAWLLGMSLCWTGGSLAQESDADANESAAIHAVVETQLQAFAADDAETAFDMASEETQALLGSPQALLGIVREWYPPLYRPKNMVFADAEVAGENAIQEVEITDSNGVVWLAVFLMSLDEHASWKVDSYHLVETESLEI